MILLRQIIDKYNDFAILFTLWKKKNLLLSFSLPFFLSANIFALTI